MSPRRRRSAVSLAVVLVLAAVAVATAFVAVRDRLPFSRDTAVRGAASGGDDTGLPPAGHSGSSSCTDPVGHRDWRVSWKTSASTIGVVLTPTAFESRATGASSWTREEAKGWELRWTGPAIASPEFGSLVPEKTLRGPLTVLARERIPVRFSPRYVSPDGACTVFATPYGSGRADQREVAVIGDSLVAQLGPVPGPEGPTLVAAELPGDRVEVNGQGGRRWTQVPEGKADLDGANLVMTDEIRGLRGASSQVVALGANDIGWASQAPDRQQFDLRKAWVVLQLSPLLDEIQASGQCTVVLTAEDRNVTYVQGNEDWYAEAATEFNDLMRRRANEDPDDDLRLWDWAAISADHHTGDPDSWFTKDTVHLNPKGRQRYAEELARAAALCP
jgi:lysophospholipase L1-like esterase